HLVHSLYPRWGRRGAPCVGDVIAGTSCGRPIVGRRRSLPRLAWGADLRDVTTQGRLEARGVAAAEGVEQLGVLGERLLCPGIELLAGGGQREAVPVRQPPVQLEHHQVAPRFDEATMEGLERGEQRGEIPLRVRAALGGQQV